MQHMHIELNMNLPNKYVYINVSAKNAFSWTLTHLSLPLMPSCYLIVLIDFWLITQRSYVFEDDVKIIKTPCMFFKVWKLFVISWEVIVGLFLTRTSCQATNENYRKLLMLVSTHVSVHARWYLY